MFSKLRKTIIDFYTKEKELDISIFKLLGTGGVLVSLIGGIQTLFTSADFTGMLVNLIAAFASVCLMWFVHATRKYLVGYLITTIVVFMGLFAWLFLEMGGMSGSIPYFFTFGIVFTLLMYKGALMYIMVVIQTLFYIVVCWFSYQCPEFVTQFESADKQFWDQLAGMVFAAIGIGLIFIMYIREYRKQQLIAEESSNAKSILLANISHEVRTPINMLLGMNEMILRESENTQINEYARNVENAGQHLLFMINQFLDLSRIDMGKESLFEEDFNLNKLVQSLGAFFGKEAEKKNLEFVMDIDKSVPENYYGDVRKLSQILSNLLSNAVKYTSKGTIVFSVQSGEAKSDSSSHSVSKKDEMSDSKKYAIHFEVSDTGSGIEEKDQKKIFESFERVDIIKNRSIEGTGLGLAISNKLANLLGTELKVRSQYGVGSVFWFDLALPLGKENTVYAGTDDFFIAPEAKILIVDDNNMNLLVAKSLLKRTMIVIDTAESALKAYEKYGQKDYDLVLMDYMMPEIDGIEAMEHLRNLDRKKGRHTPILVLTADATREKKELFLSKGFDDYLLKPIDSSLLENALRRFLPQNLVTIVSSDNKTELPAEIRVSFDRLLKKYDISLDIALKHLSQDVLQLTRVSEYFIKNSVANMTKLNNCIEQEDFENAAILVHSIKGNAGNVGAEDLFYSARRLEKRIKERDIEYTLSALPLFFMKWKRVDAGLNHFLAEFENIKPKLLSGTEETDDFMDEAEILDALLEAVHLGNQSPALKLISKLESIIGKTEETEAIREYIKNIEFDKAESLIRSCC